MASPRPWRDHLTPDEVEHLAFMERTAEALDRRRRELTREMNLIRNRATQRAAYHLATTPED